MDSIKVTRPVTVKVKVTENFKMKMASEIQNTITKLEVELKQLDFHEKRMLGELEKHNPHGLQAAKAHIQEQREKRINTKNQLFAKLKEIGKWTLGSEVIQGTVDSIGEIKVGDKWQDVFGVELVLCDDVVVEIRNK